MKTHTVGVGGGGGILCLFHVVFFNIRRVILLCFGEFQCLPLGQELLSGPKATVPSSLICLLLLFMTLCPILLISYHRKSQRTEFFGFSSIHTDCEHKEAILSFVKNFRMNKTVLSHTNL